MTNAIVINLDQLKSLMLEFIKARGGDENLLRTLTLSDFLLWLRNKEQSNEQTQRSAN